MRPKAPSPWHNAHVRLKRLYDERVSPDMTQKEFGRIYGIGSQSMVAQYLNGERPLNYDVAAKFATGLRCTIADFCPEMANELALRIFPVLGKTLRRAAVAIFGALLLASGPSDAISRVLHNSVSYYTFRDFVRRIIVLLRRGIVLI